jgi:hypothetical protein
MNEDGTNVWLHLIYFIRSYPVIGAKQKSLFRRRIKCLLIYCVELLYIVDLFK